MIAVSRCVPGERRDPVDTRRGKKGRTTYQLVLVRLVTEWDTAPGYFTLDGGHGPSVAS